MIACYSAAVDAREERGGIARQVQITAAANAQYAIAKIHSGRS